MDTNSRALSKGQAFDVTKEAAQFLKDMGYPHIYKKMDSTLRGHIGTELQAVYEVFQPSFVVVAPAFPELGRTTVDGIHYVNGKALAETEAARDPKHPVVESFIPRMIENEIGQNAGLLRQADFQKDQAAFKMMLDGFLDKGIHFLVCDATTQADLKMAAEKILAITDDVIWAGSAGLAEVLPEILGIANVKQKEAFHATEQVMAVCGSLSAITQKQVNFAKAQADVCHVEVDTKEIFSSRWDQISKKYVDSCLDAFAKGKDVILYVPSDEKIRKEVSLAGKELGLSSNEIGEYVSSALGKMVADTAKQNEKLTGLMLIGGDTAKDTTRCLGGFGFHLIKQVEAGIPLAKLIGTEKEFIVVTKAGAFGKENSIYQAMQEMKGADSNE
ncbi:four-carbon acid sugar kinase family protein [Virgibacillus halophilus]|nr:four-carbon acid sugar kinase family protein [Virgibacillus halophilus]